MKKIYLLLLLVAALYRASAQIQLQCDDRDKHSIYLLVPSYGFYRIDSVDTNPTDPIFLSPNTNGAAGVAIANNLESGTGQQTMYTIASYNNHYYSLQDTNWLDTGHDAGIYGVNPGGSASYIFNLDGLNGKVYRYDGQGDATLLVSDINTINNPIFDIATDKEGNFYIFYTRTGQIVIYNPDGLLMDSLATTGAPMYGTGLPGLAILGQSVYAVIDTVLYGGEASNHTVNFSRIKNLGSLPDRVGDIAACSQAGEVLSGIKNITVPHFMVYPNPASGSATVKLNNTERLEVTTTLGQHIFTANTGGATQYQLFFNGWSPGMYLVTAYSYAGVAARSTLVIQ